MCADLARRFNVSESLASQIFNEWIPIMSRELRKFVIWLPRETIKLSMPPAFHRLYPKTTCVIDCAEIFIQRPKKLMTRVRKYSNYKSHNTAKFLISIAPNGFIMFVSQLYGGRATDKFITEDSGFYEHILPHDQVMADRGSELSNRLRALQATFNIPSFTRGKNKLSECEVTESRRCASVRIHVERVISRVKCFRILKFTVANSLVKMLDDNSVICYGLCNLQPDVIDTDE